MLEVRSTQLKVDIHYFISNSVFIPLLVGRATPGCGNIGTLKVVVGPVLELGFATGGG